MPWSTTRCARSTRARRCPACADVVHLPGYGGELLIAGQPRARDLERRLGRHGAERVEHRRPGAPAHLRTLSVDGLYVSARLHGHTARVVISSYPRALRVPVVDLPRPAPIPIDARAAAGTPLRARRAGWVPSATLRNRRTGRTRKRALVACDDVRRTPRFTGADMLSVLTIDLSKGLPAVDADAVMTSADTVYASPTSLYVATNGGWEREDTSIHRFDLDGADRTVYRASGQVPGDLLNQFSMSEYKGVLRVATTDSSGAKSQSLVTALQTRSGRLAKIGQVGGLGEGERIYAVRFIEDRGYVVTFRQIDPLFTLDLADPTHPRVRGELKIAGYSAYLHPVGPHRLLGVGQDATPQGAPGRHPAVAVRRRRPGRAEAAEQGQARPLHLVRGGVRPPRLPVVGAAAARGDPGLRRGAAPPRRRRSTSTTEGSRGRPQPRERLRAADADRRRRPAHAQRPRAERLRPRHAQAGAGRALLSSASSARGAALQTA